MNRQRGFSIVMAIFVLVVAGLLGGYMLRVSGVQFSTFDQSLQGARAYQAAHAGIEWGIARINNGASCSDVDGQTLNFTDITGFSVHMTCNSQTYSEADRNPTLYRLNALSEFGSYNSSNYVARRIEVSIVYE